MNILKKVGAVIDAEVAEIMESARAKALEIVTTNRKALNAIAERLMEVETIERDEYEK